MQQAIDSEYNFFFFIDEFFYLFNFETYFKFFCVYFLAPVSSEAYKMYTYDLCRSTAAPYLP